jgi:multidrug efflux pump
MVSVPLTAATDLHTVEEFRKLVIKQKRRRHRAPGGRGHRHPGLDDYDFNVAFSGKRSVFIGIKVAPEANILDVAKRVRRPSRRSSASCPRASPAQIVYDATDFINTSINEVVKTLVEALLIVTVVIFLFLGSFRAVVVPVIAMPLSLVGTFFVMLALGYSINLLTLLALVLASGWWWTTPSSWSRTSTAT